MFRFLVPSESVLVEHDTIWTNEKQIGLGTTWYDNGVLQSDPFQRSYARASQTPILNPFYANHSRRFRLQYWLTE